MKENQGLYRQQFEHDNCGIGAVVNSKGIIVQVKMQKVRPETV